MDWSASIYIYLWHQERSISGNHELNMQAAIRADRLLSDQHFPLII